MPGSPRGLPIPVAMPLAGAAPVHLPHSSNRVAAVQEAGPATWPRPGPPEHPAGPSRLPPPPPSPRASEARCSGLLESLSGASDKVEAALGWMCSNPEPTALMGAKELGRLIGSLGFEFKVLEVVSHVCEVAHITTEHVKDACANLKVLSLRNEVCLVMAPYIRDRHNNRALLEALEPLGDDDRMEFRQALCLDR